MGLLELSSPDTSLNYDANPTHKLAEISPVFSWEDCAKEGWTKAEQIEKIFDSFITTRNFLGWIAWGPVEGRQKIWGCICNKFTMAYPHITDKLHPIPCRFIITGVTSYRSPPQWYQQFTQVNK
jgi:hypothetical protein